MGDSKPIDIGENFQSLNDQNSLSAYASAESSPTQSNGDQMKQNVDLRLIDEPYFPKSDTSSSINTYWGLPAASSLLIDEEDKRDALEHSREKLSQSQSFSNTKSLDQMGEITDKDYQSLPVKEKESLDKMEETIKPISELKKELSESDLFKLNVVDGEEDLVNVDLKEDASLKSEQLPEMSIPRSKSSAMSFIEKMFTGKPKAEQEVEKEIKKLEETQAKPSLTAALTSAATSASSPNPECSPYKFLMSEYSAKPAEPISSLKLETQVPSEVPEKEVVDEKLIEDLASLDRQGSEEHDPILSGASKSNSKTGQAKTKTEKQNTKSKSSKSTSKSHAQSTKTDSSKVDHIPASSREFCMDLNFNLASAAAAQAGGPVVVVDNTNKSPVAKEHNKFTSNASTSSIHNDLKMILEESKDGKKGSGKENKKLNKSVDGAKKEKPKPQRVKKDSKNASKNSISNASFNSSANETTSNSMTVETSNLSPTSKTNNLNLIKMMMLMVENNNTKKEGKNKQMEQSTSFNEPNLIEMAKQNGRYKYSKEFLMQIRDKRASFIDQIQPEIFKAYCYCMNGKYWDPEKYFDIVQFPGDYDRIQSNRNTYNRSSSYNKSTGGKFNKKHTPNGTFNHSHSKNMSFGTTPTAVPNYMQDESPQALQVPKNSPKFTDAKTKESTVQSIFESLGLNTDHMDKSKLDADKILLGLIKKDKKQEKSSTVLNTLNKKPSQSPNILENLLPKAEVKPASQKHHPLILTAQELEMSQLHQEKYKLPNEISMTKLEELQHSMESNDSFAYKQLVKNLSTHPLNSATALNNKLEASLSKLQNKQKVEKADRQISNNKPSWQVSNDGTNMLKQLLNLKTENTDKHKSNKPRKTHKSNKSPHLSMSNGSASVSSSAGSSPVDGSNKFPAMNPHEKPFETYEAEENRKKIEQVVASALSQVLSKSPNSTRQLSPTPRSPIQDLIEKINYQHKEQDLKNSQQEHFNSLLNRMNIQQQVQMKQETNESDILRWFNDAKQTRTHMPAQSLSEIEYMQMHRPASTLNKLF